MLQLQILCATTKTWCSQINLKKKAGDGTWLCEWAEPIMKRGTNWDWRIGHHVKEKLNRWLSIVNEANHSLGEAILRETRVSWGFEWWGFSRSQYHIKDRGSACLFCSLFIYFLIEDLPSTCKEAIAREQKKMKLKIGGWVYLLPRAATTKSLQTWWLKLVAGMSSLSVLRAGRLKSRCRQGCFLLDARGRVCFTLLAFGGGRRC